MSWLTNSIAASLHLDDDDDDEDEFNPENTDLAAAASTPMADGVNRDRNPKDADDHHRFKQRQVDLLPSSSSPYDERIAPRGVKEDLSELSDTLTRNLWGVASFLAPPPQISDRDRQSDESDEDYDDDGAGIAGIRNEMAEFGGDFGVSVPNDIEYESEEEFTVEEYARRGVVGVTEEVVAFARDIALHPETWIDFPLPDDDIEEDFELSDAQQEHALAIERLAPQLAAIRIELCLSYMSEGCFWKIYFALVHPRLSRHDAEILSTPEIVKAREMLSQELRSHSKLKSHESGSGSTFVDNATLSHEEHLFVPVGDHFESIPVDISTVGPGPSVDADVEIDKHALTSTEVPIVDKRVVDETPMTHKDVEKPRTVTSKFIDQKFEEDEDDWLEEVNCEAGPLKGTSYPPGNYDDISFSDLEDDEDIPSSFKQAGKSNEKVSSNTLKNTESNDWLDIKDVGIA